MTHCFLFFNYCHQVIILEYCLALKTALVGGGTSVSFVCVCLACLPVSSLFFFSPQPLYRWVDNGLSLR